MGYVSVRQPCAGGIVSNITTITLPGNLAAKTYYLVAVADYNNLVTETLETNNGKLGNAVAITFGPDLVISAVSGPTTAVRGTTVGITNDVFNQGAGRAWNVGLFNVGIYLVQGTKVVKLGQRSLDNLEKGETSSVITTVTIPNTLAVGTYSIVAAADDSKIVNESNESNNNKAGNILKVSE